MAKKHDKIKGYEVKIKELEDGWKRTAADFENYRKRSEEQRLEFLMLAKADFVAKITPVLDNFRRAFALRHSHTPKKEQDSNWVRGVKQIEKQLEDILSSEGLKRIDTSGEFDHNLHEAISCEENDKIPCDHIIAEIESGWQFDGKILKPAKVRVSKGK